MTLRRQRPPPRRVAKVLVVAPSWVGDAVLAHAIVPGLVARRIEVHFLAPPGTAPLVARMPGVAAAHRMAARRGRLDLRVRRAAAKQLRKHGFDQAIVLPGSLKSALTPALAGIPKRTGFRGEARFGLINDMRALRRRELPRLVDRFAALADTTPAPPRLRPDVDARARLLDALGIGLGKPAIALCPGAAYGPAKRWPAEHFGALGALCADAGANVWVLGTAADRPAAAAIRKRAPAIDLTGRTSLAEAVDLLSAARAAVANDSGLMHVAGALGTPLVGLFGATSPAFTPPIGGRAAVVERHLECRPCFARRCPLGHLDCLRGIPPDRVFAELRALGVFGDNVESAAQGGG